MHWGQKVEGKCIGGQKVEGKCIEVKRVTCINMCGMHHYHFFIKFSEKFGLRSRDRSMNQEEKGRKCGSRELAIYGTGMSS